MAQNSEVLAMLDHLIQTCRDGQDGYRDAAEHVTHPGLKQFFNEQSLVRAQYAGELEQEVQRLGERSPSRSGSIAGAVHRAWFDLKATLGGGDKTIIESVEQGEDWAKEAYEEAVRADLPDNLLSIIRRQQAGIQAAHDRVRNFRDTLAA